MAGSPLLYLIFYAIMEKKHSVAAATSGELNESESQANMVTWKEKLSTAGKILPLVGSLFIAVKASCPGVSMKQMEPFP